MGDERSREEHQAGDERSREEHQAADERSREEHQAGDERMPEEKKVSEVRRRGLQKMKEVYGWDMPDFPSDYFGFTVEHLFGTIWTRPELSMRDRRLLTLSTVATQGLPDLLEIQLTAALNNGELTVAEVREIAIFLTHYIGWPKGQKIDGIAEKVIAKQQKGDAARDQSWKGMRGD